MTTTTIRSTAVLCQRYVVAGMSCGHCESAVVAEVTEIPGVTSAAADAVRGVLVIEATWEVDLRTIALAVEAAGYEVVAR